jgi:hypothetical protein
MGPAKPQAAGRALTLDDVQSLQPLCFPKRHQTPASAHPHGDLPIISTGAFVGTVIFADIQPQFAVIDAPAAASMEREGLGGLSALEWHFGQAWLDSYNRRRITE